MKTANRFPGLVFVLATTLAVAQQPPVPNLDGVWRARIDATATGCQSQGELNLVRSEGSWRVMVKSTKDPCVGVLTPVSWQPAGTDGGIELTILGSKALTGCSDSVVAFKQINDKTFLGKSAAGFESLSRGLRPSAA